jgi:hypothetical protein
MQYVHYATQRVTVNLDEIQILLQDDFYTKYVLRQTAQVLT